MIERLCDVQAVQFVITCGLCERRGTYRIDGLRRRFGDDAAVLDVHLRLTQTCRYQREVGSWQPNAYGVACRAKLDITEAVAKGGPPSMTGDSLQRVREMCNISDLMLLGI